MAEFKVKKSEKETITIRLEKEYIARIEELAQESDVSKNEIISQMIEFALSTIK